MTRTKNTPLYSPTQQDAEDLRWYFNLGPSPVFRGRPRAFRTRWERINRRLNGRGWALCEFYAAQRDNDAYVAADYAEYCRQRSKRDDGEPFIVASVETLVAVLNSRKPSHEIVTRRESLSLVSAEASHATPKDIESLIFNGRLEHSTWGDVRVEADMARIFLEIASVESVSPLLSKQDVLNRLAELCRRYEGAPTTAGAKREESVASRVETLQELRRSTTAPDLRDLYSREMAAVKECAGDPTTTTVSEIAKSVSLHTRQVREMLVKLGCPNARKPRARLPWDWFVSERGKEFLTRVERETGRKPTLLFETALSVSNHAGKRRPAGRKTPA